MSGQVDTRALRALIEEYDALRPHLSREPEMTRASNIVHRLADAAPALLDEVDGLRSVRDAQINVIETVRADRDRFMAERDALRARVAELERELERLREAARAVCEGTMSSEVSLGLRILRAALAPRAEVKP